MRYRTKIDIGGPLILVVLSCSPAAIGVAILIWLGARDPGGWILLIVSLFLLLFFGVIGWPVDYDPAATSGNGEPILLVRFGLLRYEIPIALIRDVRPAREISSSPAWSYDRIKVVYPTRSGIYRSLLISPLDRDGFLDELARRATHLERIGTGLVRKEPPRPPEARS